MHGLPTPDSAHSALVRRYHGAYAQHQHSHAQVLVGLQGCLQLEVDGHAAFVDASCGLVLPAGCWHGYFSAGTASVWVLDTAPGQATERLRRFATGPAWHGRLASQAPQALLATLGALPSLQPRRQLDLDALLRRVDQDLARPWRLDELAALCHLSPQRFRARFAELTGQSPLAHLRQRRLAEAERLLALGWALDTTALHVGYAGASALSHALRRDRATGARGIRRAQPLAAAGRALRAS